MLSELEAICTQITCDLNEEDGFLTNVKESEDKVIIEFAKTMNVGLPFISDLPGVKREMQVNECVPYYAFFVNELIIELRSNCASCHLPPRECASKKWPSEDEIAPFYARVWENYKPKNEAEIEVFKKETVKVTQSGFSDYWLVQKTNTKVGYVPCSLLEPVD